MQSASTSSAGFPSWFVHQSLEDGATPARLAHFAKYRLGCDRVTLLIPQGRGWRALEVSGVAKVHRHSVTVKAIEHSAKVLLRSGNRLFYPAKVELSPQENEAIDQLLDATNASEFVLLPLVPGSFSQDPVNSSSTMSTNARQECIGALLCEQFSGADHFQRQLLELNEVTAHCALALANWQYMRSVPGVRGLRLLGKLLSPIYRWKLLSITVFLMALLISASYFQTEHWVDATGELQPAKSRNIFAPSSAIVSEVLVEHGQLVEAGALLLRLQSSQLQQLERQIAGELRTSQQRLIAIKSQKISGASVSLQANVPASGGYDPQTTELLQLEEKIQNLQLQLKLTEAELNRLEIRAPIAGQIATWDLERRLKERPVQSGDWLLTVNDTSADQWKLELKIPQPILSVVSSPLVKQPPVQFRIGSMPEKSFSARLVSVGTATQVDDSLGNVVMAQAIVESPLAQWQPQSGSSVRAQIACGRKSLLAAYSFDLRQWWYYNVDFRLGSYLQSLGYQRYSTGEIR